MERNGMTPKEALEVIFEIERKLNTSAFRIGAEYIGEELELLKKTLIPPTVDEVCALIEKDIKGKARYSYGQFYIDNEKVDDILFGVFGAKTLIAIGKFYEGLEK